MNKNLIRVSKSSLGEREKKAVLEVLDNEFLGMGPKVQDFEKHLTSFFNRPAVCVSNGTAALQLALQAVHIGPGDEVIVPSFTYLASFQAISATGAKPIPCDIMETTLTLDPNDMMDKISSKTKAIMPVHYAGGAGKLDIIYQIADENNLRVIEDAAHAFGSVYKSKKIGSFGDIACFSFDGIKNITSGEGGCIVSNDQTTLERLRNLRLLAVKGDTKARFSNSRTWIPDVEEQGWRYHMSDIMAAIGIQQLKRFDEISNKRRLLAKRYDHNFKDSSSIGITKLNYNDIVPHIYVVRIPNLRDKSFLRSELLRNNIQTGEHYYPNHMLSFYSKENNQTLKITEKIFKEILTLPLHLDLSLKEVDHVSNVLKEILDVNSSLGILNI